MFGGVRKPAGAAGINSAFTGWWCVPARNWDEECAHAWLTTPMPLLACSSTCKSAAAAVIRRHAARQSSPSSCNISARLGQQNVSAGRFHAKEGGCVFITRWSMRAISEAPLTITAGGVHLRLRASMFLWESSPSPLGDECVQTSEMHKKKTKEKLMKPHRPDQESSTHEDLNCVHSCPVWSLIKTMRSCCGWVMCTDGGRGEGGRGRQRRRVVVPGNVIWKLHIISYPCETSSSLFSLMHFLFKYISETHGDSTAAAHWNNKPL